jgi:hypothetical protein
MNYYEIPFWEMFRTVLLSFTFPGLEERIENAERITLN